MDGVDPTIDRIEVEEVKSTSLDGERLMATTAADWPHFVSQLETYMWALDTPDGKPVVGRLVLISRLDGATHLIGVASDPVVVQGRVEARFRGWIAERERRLAWMSRRRGQSLPPPFPAWRTGQQEISESVEWGLEAGNAVLVEAPTGAGKTAALLHGALRIAMKTDRQIFWATARTTQQRAPIEALMRWEARDVAIHSVRLSAKKKMCVNDVLSCNAEKCRFARDYGERAAAEQRIVAAVEERSHLGREWLRAYGTTHRLCPFELSLDVTRHTDVVVGDLNYVFDPGAYLRRHFDGNEARGWIVVVDEVHQLVDRARGYLSPRLAKRDVERARQRMSSHEHLRAFVAILDRTMTLIDRQQRAAQAWSKDGFAVVEPETGSWRQLADDVEAVGLDYAIFKIEKPVWRDDEDDEWMAFAASLLRLSSLLDGMASDTVATVGRGSQGASFGLWCLDPGAYLGPRIAALGGFAGASATLGPPGFLSDMVGMANRRVDEVRIGSVFPPENRRVVVAPRISTVFRDREKHSPATAALIGEAAGAVPGNVAVFFPSFDMMGNVMDGVTTARHVVCTQQPGMTDDDRDAMLARLDGADPPTLLAAVLGGSFAEGIDLPEGALDAVFIVGPGFPPVGLQRDLLRATYDAAFGGQGYRYATLVPGLTRVVQAAGRLIRRSDDRGVVLLVGRRFVWRDIAELLPDDWEPLPAADPVAEVAAFFAPDDQRLTGGWA